MNAARSSTAIGLLALLFSPAGAEPTLELRVSGPAEIFQGDPESTSVDPNGLVGVGPIVSSLVNLGDKPVVALLAAGGKVYAATSAGGVARIEATGKFETLLADDKAIVTALAEHGGTLFAATGPSGSVVSLAGPAKPVYVPTAKYVWAMLADPDGLVLATGEPGHVIRVPKTGAAKALFESSETHVRALARHPDLGIIAGGGQKGIVYRIAEGRTFALYDSSMEEVTAIVVDPASGDIFAALISEAKNGALVPQKTVGPVANDPKDESAPIRGSEVVRIAKSGRVDVLWSSRREGALGLAFDGAKGALAIATGTGPTGRGRVYRVDLRDNDRIELIARVGPTVASAIALAPTGGAFLVGTAPAGEVLRVGPGARTEAVYLSAEQELERVSRIGRIWYDADVPTGAKVAIQLRAGNTSKQDETWSDWSEVVRDPAGGRVSLPEARYVQFRAQLSAAGNGAAPSLKSLHASVIRMNGAPEIAEVFVLRPGIYLRSMPAEEEKEKTLTITTSALNGLRPGRGQERREVRARQGVLPGMSSVGWKASDPNGDELIFRVEIARDGEREYLLLADGLDAPFHSFDGRAWPDGRYRVRVTATDRPSNSPDRALFGERRSEPFVIDNTPPKVEVLEAKALGPKKLQVVAVVADETSLVELAQVSINGSPWVALPAADGLVDSTRERFELIVEPQGALGDPMLRLGRNELAVRAEDAVGNHAARTISFELR